MWLKADVTDVDTESTESCDAASDQEGDHQPASS